MASLKELRKRISSIKSTQKITSAMKMVAAARLRKAQQMISKSSFYAKTLLDSANRVLQELQYEESKSNLQYIYPEMMRGNGKSNNYLLLVFSSDRGLCGGFNVNIVKETVLRINELEANGKEVKVICVGRKARDILRRKHAEYILDTYEGIATKGADYEEASALAQKILGMYANNEFDICEIITSKFNSAVNRELKSEQVFPVVMESRLLEDQSVVSNKVDEAFYDYEPELMIILENLLPLIFKAMVFQAIVHSQASEQGARMSSMDNATRNAKDMIARLTLKYNGLRQSAITNELIEIISGAEAI